MELLAILIAVLIVVAIARSNRPDPHGRIRRVRERRTPPPLPRPFKEPPHHRSVNAAHLIFSIVFLPFVLLFWALGSIGDAVAAPIHLAVGFLATALAVIATLVGGTPRRLWRTAARQFANAGRSLLSILTRLLRSFGLGGLVEEMKEELKKPVDVVPPAVPRRPPAHRAYPFEDRYRIESHLGAGGSTARLFVVRRISGRDPVGERLVLKYFDMEMGSHLEEVIRESRGMQLAKDMGIVLDHRLAEDHFYYVMPYYEGETLTRASARLHRQLPGGETLPAEDVRLCLGWMAELLRILDGYHRHGVIHKDVKPDNVIVTDDGIRLVDLGLLTPLTSALTLTTHGTEYFRDPEMVKLAVQGKRVKDVEAVRFDVYSAGAVMYLLIEGSFPACGPLSRFSRPVPLALSWITSRAMAEGTKRYPSVASMRADLEAVLRRMEDEDLDAIQASALPSFGGFEPAPTAPPTPAFEAEPVRQAAWAPPPPAAAPRDRRTSWTGVGCLAILILLLAAAGGIYFVVGPVAPAARHTAETVSGPEVYFSSALRSFTAGVRKIGVDLDRVPVLLVSDDAPHMTELMGKTRVALSAAGFTPHPSNSLRTKVRDQLRDGIEAEEVTRILAELMGDDTLPMVMWIREQGHTGSSRCFDVRFFYRSISRAKVVTFPGDA